MSELARVGSVALSESSEGERRLEAPIQSPLMQLVPALEPILRDAAEDAAEPVHIFNTPVDEKTECSITRARAGWLVGRKVGSKTARDGDWTSFVEWLLAICDGDGETERVFTELYQHGVSRASWRYAAAELLKRRTHPFLSPLRNPASYLCATAQRYERRRLEERGDKPTPLWRTP
jgi:hypothetical protein